MRMLKPDMRKPSMHSDTGRGSSHHFPGLEEGRPSAVSHHGRSERSFKPLYASGDGCFKDMWTRETGSGGENDPCNGDTAREEQCYRQGYDQGRHEAEQVCRQNTAPHLHAFRESLEALSGDLDSLSANRDERIAGLAVAIAAKIMKTEPIIDPTDDQSIRKGLQQWISDAYRFEIDFNPDDLNLLSEQDGFSESGTEPHECIAVRPNPDLPRGAVRESENRVPIEPGTVAGLIDQLVSLHA
jgi:hypothetical protein